MSLLSEARFQAFSKARIFDAASESERCCAQSVAAVQSTNTRNTLVLTAWHPSNNRSAKKAFCLKAALFLVRKAVICHDEGLVGRD
jgi:predicted lactoylglutathione lyase